MARRWYGQLAWLDSEENVTWPKILLTVGVGAACTVGLAVLGRWLVAVGATLLWAPTAVGIWRRRVSLQRRGEPIPAEPSRPVVADDVPVLRQAFAVETKPGSSGPTTFGWGVVAVSLIAAVVTVAGAVVGWKGPWTSAVDWGILAIAVSSAVLSVFVLALVRGGWLARPAFLTLMQALLSYAIWSVPA
ncbi:hypothetical protein [Kribbia dieselivorans]|uniref:hypothetical protein n=1 Tax=Kribbia dieselivorans TaxID=331526 RepID=UPI000839AFEF|nr:hypothetical protein [Kribbia dieselivorans]